MSRKEEFKKASDDYVNGEPDGAQKTVGQVGFEFGAEHGYQYAIKRSDNVIKLIVKMAKKDIAFTEEEGVKFYHEEMEE